MAHNLRQQRVITTLDNSKLKLVDDFQYLGSWIDKTKKDLEIRKANARAASNKLTVVWKSNSGRDLKIRFSRASVKSVLLDADRCIRETTRWLLYKAPTHCPEHKLAGSYIQQGGLWLPASNFNNASDTQTAV